MNPIDEVRENKEIKWDILDGHDEVFVIIFNRSRSTLVCTKQFRPGLYYNSILEDDKHNIDGSIDIQKYPISNGNAIEFCTGIVDQNKSLEEIAVNSLREECGYEVDKSSLKKIINANGILKQTFFYTDVTDQMKIHHKREDVEVIEYTISQIKDIIARPAFLNGSFSFIYGLTWFLLNRN